MVIFSSRIFAAFLLTASSLTWGQAVKEFEVASVKPSASADDHRVGIQISPGGRWVATNVPLPLLLQIAYDLRPGQLVGAPNWIQTARYDVEAKIDSSLGSNPKPEEIRPYLQNLVEKRFQIKAHRETKEMPVYVLTVAKGGPKLKESAPEARGPQIRMGRGQMTCVKIKTDIFARELSRQLGKPVMNQTDLNGDYDLELTWTPDGPTGDGGGPGGHGEGPGGGGGGSAAPGGEGPSIFTAIQEQLGLKLDSKKSPMEVLVVDKIEKAEEN